MEAVIFVGIQATGKSTFFKSRFADTHIRLNLDMLKTRHREKILLNAMLESKQSFVVDNTNPTKKDRARFIGPAKDAKFRVIGFYFQSRVSEALARNRERSGKSIVPDAAIRATVAKLERPSYDEGYCKLYHVSLSDGDFDIQSWADEV